MEMIVQKEYSMELGGSGLEPNLRQESFVDRINEDEQHTRAKGRRR